MPAQERSMSAPMTSVGWGISARRTDQPRSERAETRQLLAATHRRDERPVVADRAALEAPDPEPQRIERDARDPQRRERVALAAADRDLAGEAVAAPAQLDRLHRGPGDGEAERDATAATAAL